MTDFERYKPRVDRRYFKMYNDILWDGNISAKAKAVLVTIFAFPDDWSFTVRGLIKVMKEGKAAIYSALAELIEAGYVEKRVTRDESTGKFLKVKYSFYSTNDPVEKLDHVLCNSPLTDFRDADNRTLLSNKRTNRRTNKELSNRATQKISKIHAQALEVFEKAFPGYQLENPAFTNFLIREVTSGAADNPKWLRAWKRSCQRWMGNDFNPSQNLVDAYYEDMAGIPMADRFQ